MKQGDIISAYKTLAIINRKPGLPFWLNQKLFLKKKELEPFWEMQKEQEIVLIEATGQTIDNYTYTPELKKGLHVIEESEAVYDAKPLEIIINEELAEKMGLTAEMLEHLDGFVHFTDGVSEG